MDFEQPTVLAAGWCWIVSADGASRGLVILFITRFDLLINVMLGLRSQPEA